MSGKVGAVLDRLQAEVRQALKMEKVLNFKSKDGQETYILSISNPDETCWTMTMAYKCQLSTGAI